MKKKIGGMKIKYKATIQRLVNTKRCIFYSYGTNRLGGKINRNPVKQKKNKYSSFFADLKE